SAEGRRRRSHGGERVHPDPVPARDGERGARRRGRGGREGAAGHPREPIRGPPRLGTRRDRPNAPPCEPVREWRGDRELAGTRDPAQGRRRSGDHPGAGGRRMTPLLSPAELEAIQRHARADYPAECCGVLLVRPGPAEERRLLACRNIQDELHAKDPERFTRTARTAYYIAHSDLLEIGRREGEGFEVPVNYPPP